MSKKHKGINSARLKTIYSRQDKVDPVVKTVMY